MANHGIFPVDDETLPATTGRDESLILSNDTQRAGPVRRDGMADPILPKPWNSVIETEPSIAGPRRTQTG